MEKTIDLKTVKLIVEVVLLRKFDDVDQETIDEIMSEIENRFSQFG
ncbi:hypothetical protein [Laceyella putida]|uniref:Uncharacterized protein n=1 Tax=Laceyella putida TaxID=110101 RepID=A0ABW2RR96_9BACL